MELSLVPSNLPFSDFMAHLSSYPEQVPKEIQGLEELRLHEVPKILAKRREDGDVFLEKTEVTGLVEWKL